MWYSDSNAHREWIEKMPELKVYLLHIFNIGLVASNRPSPLSSTVQTSGNQRLLPKINLFVQSFVIFAHFYCSEFKQDRIDLDYFVRWILSCNLMFQWISESRMIAETRSLKKALNSRLKLTRTRYFSFVAIHCVAPSVELTRRDLDAFVQHARPNKMTFLMCKHEKFVHDSVVLGFHSATNLSGNIQEENPLTVSNSQTLSWFYCFCSEWIIKAIVKHNRAFSFNGVLSSCR